MGESYLSAIELTKPEACPACGEKNVVDVGQLHKVEGVITLAEAGHLYGCPHCKLLFRFPYLDAEQLTQAYSQLNSENWLHNDHREDFNIARQVLVHYGVVGKVLDVGCFRGDFLNSLPDGNTLYGIEPSPQARQIAEERGVRLVADMIENLDCSDTKFDVITMLDVIEHLPQPFAALNRLVSALQKGGILIVATGNTDALPWRLMRQNYWYYFPEHVSFFNKIWFNWVSRELDMTLLQVKKFSHFKAPFIVRMRQLAECLVYYCAHCFKKQSIAYKIITKIYPFNRALAWSPPVTSSWSDHALFILKKN